MVIQDSKSKCSGSRPSKVNVMLLSIFLFIHISILQKTVLDQQLPMKSSNVFVRFIKWKPL